MEEFDFLTVKEFGAKLKVGREQVYKWIEERKVKAIRVTKSSRSPWRIPFTEVLRLHSQAYEEDNEDLF